MSKFKNNTGGVLTVSDLGILVGPGEKFDWPGHDPEVHGLPTGCTWLDAPKPKDSAAGDDGKAPGTDDGEQHRASHGRAKSDGSEQAKETAK